MRAGASIPPAAAAPGRIRLLQVDSWPSSISRLISSEMRDNDIKIAIEGTRGAQLHADLDWNPNDVTIIKKRYSAFFKTELEDLLEEFGVGELVLCGINTHACISMAAIGAYQRDFRVVLAEECIDSYNEEHARVSLDYRNGKIANEA
ncbi:isochorismatase family protein, partial [Rhizobium leguminosarum]|nr:isochorismatase family protein [Rhizobium ruizarguesonis]